MPTIKQVADFFIRRSDIESGDAMTHLRLQKLVYYAQAWSLALRNKPLVENEFEAWPNGPVSPSLWAKFKTYGFDPIPATASMSSDNAFSQDELTLLNEIWRVYGQCSARRLSDLTHAEPPWQEARKGLSSSAKSNENISRELMRTYYRSLLKT